MRVLGSQPETALLENIADTNIFISALMFGGLPGTFLNLAFVKSFQLVTSPVLQVLRNASDYLYESVNPNMPVVTRLDHHRMLLDGVT